MATTSRFLDEVMDLAAVARDQTRMLDRVGPWVDTDLPIPRPYLAHGPIKLVVIGQDPTVQRAESRRNITTVLNLDRSGSLRRYLEDVCERLGFALDQHLYATNAYKCFFTAPPTTLKDRQQVDVLEGSAHLWLPVLRRELAQFPDAMVISLGEPVLSVLVEVGYPRSMRHYWGYHEDWRQGKRTAFRYISAVESRVGRALFSVVHEPTLRGRSAAFYREQRDAYFAYLRHMSPGLTAA